MRVPGCKTFARATGSQAGSLVASSGARKVFEKTKWAGTYGLLKRSNDG